MDKSGLWSGPAALYSAGKRVCVFVYAGGLWVNFENAHVVWVYLEFNNVCVFVCVCKQTWVYVNICEGA